MDLPLRRIIRLDPLAAPEFLGGLPSGGETVNKIPIDSVYNNLAVRKPLADLPTVHSRDTMFSSAELEDAYMKIYHGDCSLKVYSMFAEHDDEDGVAMGGDYCHIPQDEDNTDAKLISITAIVEDSASFQGALINIAVQAKSDFAGMQIHSIDTETGQRFFSSLTQGQREALSYRVLHLFLRANGEKLGGDAFAWLFKYLGGTYCDLKYWKENIDLCTIGADLSLNVDVHATDRILFLVRFGEALEYAGKFQGAGDIYKEIIDKYKNMEQHRTEYDDVHFNKFAGLAYTRAKNNSAAERFYVAALHHELARIGGSWVKAEERTLQLFADMISLQIAIQVEEAVEKGVSQVGCSLEVTLATLCCVAGLDSDPYIQQYKGYTSFKDVLKPKYYKPKNARIALQNAVASGKVEKFHSTILSCGTKASQGIQRTHDPEEQKTKRSAKVDARKLVTQLHGPQKDRGQHTRLVCANPLCRELKFEANLKYCPRQTVCYCGPDCQLAHWDEHKIVCSYYKNKKKASKSNKKVP